LVCCPTSALSLCAFLDLCWVLASPIGGWFVIPLLLSAFMPLPISAGCWWLLWVVSLLLCSCCQPLLLYLRLFTESSVLRVWLLVTLLFPGAGSVFHPHLCCCITVCCLCFSVLLGEGGFSLSRGCAGLFSWGRF
jgi:hypothetical protein